jgi:hypothetical protein
MESGIFSMLHSKKHEKDSPNAPLRGKLEASLVVVRDLKDQPQSEYILLTGSGRPLYYAVDSFREEYAGVMAFYRRGEHTEFGERVYVCRTEGSWALVKRDAVNILSEADYTQHQLDDNKDVEAFYEKVDPEGWKESKKVAMQALGINGLDKDERPPVGQYL